MAANLQSLGKRFVGHIRSRDSVSIIPSLSLRNMWNHRNCLVHEGVHGEPLELVYFVANYLQCFEAAQYRFATSRSPESMAHWIPPIKPALKINVDASLLKSQNAAGVVSLLGLYGKHYSLETTQTGEYTVFRNSRVVGCKAWCCLGNFTWLTRSGN